MDRLQRSLRATFTGMAVNAALAGTKLLAGVWGHSHALVADAVESMADIGSSLIVWRGLVVAATPADADHPYGHGKAEPLAAAIVSTLLLLAATWIALASVREILHPHRAPAPYTLGVLIAVVLVKEGLFRFVQREAKTVESSAVLSDAWHHRSDAITSLAAGIGISVALIGGPGYESADDVAALVAAGLIAWNGWRLLRPALDELMDVAPAPALTARIRQVAGGVPDVDAVEKCVVRKMGYQYYVDMHVEVAPDMTVQRAHQIAHLVKDKVRASVPGVSDVLVHIEPRRASPVQDEWTASASAGDRQGHGP
jgi:cation diffusion facilitator family transporter